MIIPIIDVLAFDAKTCFAISIGSDETPQSTHSPRSDFNTRATGACIR